MSAFDELMDEARDAGVDPDWIERVTKASAGSPLRKERDEAKAALEQAITEANRYRTATLNSQFKELGIKAKPDALNIPADLDPLDTEKVRGWAVEMGLADPPPPPTPADEQREHQMMAAASSGAIPPAAHDARAQILAAETEDEFWARAMAAGQARE